MFDGGGEGGGGEVIDGVGSSGLGGVGGCAVLEEVRGGYRHSRRVGEVCVLSWDGRVGGWVVMR